MNTGAAMELAAAGLPAFPTMLIIAGVALLLGIIALRLARRHTHRERREHAERESREQTAGDDGPAGDQKT